MSYNKSEKSTPPADCTSNNTAVKASRLNYWSLLPYAIFWFYFFIDFNRKLPDATYNDLYWFLGITAVVAILSIRSCRINVYGKLCYNDDHFHYEGYTTDIYPKKQVVDILWTDIASVRIFTDKFGNLYTHEILMIEKTDNTKEYLNINYFFNSTIIDLIYQRLLALWTANPIDNPVEYKINLHNYKPMIGGYLNFETFINDQLITVEDKSITLDVKTGDLLALNYHKYQFHLFRLNNPLLTEWYVDHICEDFDLAIRQAKPKQENEE